LYPALTAKTCVIIKSFTLRLTEQKDKLPYYKRQDDSRDVTLARLMTCTNP